MLQINLLTLTATCVSNAVRSNLGENMCQTRNLARLFIGLTLAFGWSQTITTVAGNGNVGLASGDGGPATSAVLALIGTAAHQGLAVNSAGDLYIADAAHARIRKVDMIGGLAGAAGDRDWEKSGDGGGLRAW